MLSSLSRPIRPACLAAALSFTACAPQASRSDTPASARPPASGGSAAMTPTAGAGGATSGAGGTPASGSGGTGSPGGGADGGPTPAPAGPVVALPMSVTTHFPNQGWFGDDSLAEAIAGGKLIQQGVAVTGPCAMRVPDARGACLKIVYTPPAGVMPPATGGWAGVFFLTTIQKEDLTAMPPRRIGQANWGAEPGKNIAPGASKISFAAAAEQDGVAVTFLAGVKDADSFLVPEQIETLGPTWKTAALPLAGATYGTNVVGAFAWVLKDTTKPVTFYLDNIVWE